MTTPVMLPSSEERREIFYYLVRNTSYTAWNRIYQYYKRWVELFEKNVASCEKHPQPGKPAALQSSDLISLLKGQVNFENALRRLKAGDKRVFMYNTHGDIEMAGRPLDHWNEAVMRFEEWHDIVIDVDRIPFWREMDDARIEVSKAWGECGMSFLQTRDPDEPAPLLYGVWLQGELKKAKFPLSLPEVPNPENQVFAKTGEVLPFTGIWEPVTIEKTGGFLGMFKAPVIPDDKTFQVAGCMNYLHATDIAPKVSIETEKNNEDVDATWRLLWIDDRYEDGTIPIEESGYVFSQPDRKSDVPEASGDALIQNSGETCRRSGIWAQVRQPEISQQIGLGQAIPTTQGTSVAWIWTRDA